MAQNNIIQNSEWHGYLQARFTINYNDVNSFALRRMKLWINSTPNFNEHWGYKIQTTITSFQNEKFLLQDVYSSYHTSNFKIKFGQFVPQYSLQRFQPDYKIPLAERANVINALIPDGMTGVRDIGLEGNYSGVNKNLNIWLGVFNGYGINEYRFDNSGIMLTNKTELNIPNINLTIGYSVLYRKADQLRFKNILPDSVLYTGNDYRFNLFAIYDIRCFHVQTDYLMANLDNKIANGYYILASLNLGKNIFVASWEEYDDLIDDTNNLPEIHVGYNYLVDQDKVKFMLDNGVKIDKGKLESFSTTVQFQLFFN